MPEFPAKRAVFSFIRQTGKVKRRINKKIIFRENLWERHGIGSNGSKRLGIMEIYTFFCFGKLHIL